MNNSKKKSIIKISKLRGNNLRLNKSPKNLNNIQEKYSVGSNNFNVITSNYKENMSNYCKKKEFMRRLSNKICH